MARKQIFASHESTSFRQMTRLVSGVATDVSYADF